MATEDAPLGSLLYKDCTLECMLDPAHWVHVCPWLSCSTHLQTHTSAVNVALTKGAHASLCNKGYFQINPMQINLDEKHASINALLARGVLRLMELGYSPCFLLMYNEAWTLSSIMNNFMKLATDGRNMALGDFYIFAVLSAKQMLAASRNPNAFVHSYLPGPPHRDRPDSDASSFTDACPHYTSTWMALTTATTANSCLYCVPLQHDVGYFLQGDARGATIAVHHVLAKPLQQGAFLAFSHRLLHWGGSLQPTEGQEAGEGCMEEGGGVGEVGEEEEDAPPRIAFTNAYAAGVFEQPYFDHEQYPQDGTTPMGLRLGLACGQQIQYEHLGALAKYDLALLRRLFHSQKVFFSPAYFEKIALSCQMLTFIKRQQRQPASKV